MKIAIIGLGSVGKGLLNVIEEKQLDLVVTGIADSRSAIIDPGGVHVDEVLEAKNRWGTLGDRTIGAMEVITRGDYEVLVEVTPTNAETGEPALTYMRSAILLGKHVVTSNKGPIARDFQKLRELAVTHNVELRYEATVAGAIPIMHTLQQGLAGNEVLALYGVLNGTCNYILTRMAAEGLTYEQALLEAREMGYAEADPTYDVKGIDAAIKLVILANMIWRNNANLEKVEIAGIDLLTTDAIRLAEDQDCTIRLIAEMVPKKGLLRVSPRIIAKNHPLVVDGSLNAITLETDLAGEVTLIGKGAGSRETASAILGDLLFIRDRYAQRH
jgi:homoserine dehydrogenase